MTLNNYEERKKQVDLFIMTKGKYFPEAEIYLIKEKLLAASDSSFTMANALSYKDPMIMIVISILGGYFGIDRFILGEVGLGILKLITGGACGIWYLIDLFLIMNKTKEYNFRQMMNIL